jgi:hypothetical protein
MGTGTWAYAVDTQRSWSTVQTAEGSTMIRYHVKRNTSTDYKPGVLNKIIAFEIGET